MLELRLLALEANAYLDLMLKERLLVVAEDERLLLAHYSGHLLGDASASLGQIVGLLLHTMPVGEGLNPQLSVILHWAPLARAMSHLVLCRMALTFVAVARTSLSDCGSSRRLF